MAKHPNRSARFTASFRSSSSLFQVWGASQSEVLFRGETQEISDQASRLLWKAERARIHTTIRMRACARYRRASFQLWEFVWLRAGTSTRPIATALNGW